VHAANVWLHSNVPGKRDELADAPPFCLELYPGIGLAAAGMRASPRFRCWDCGASTAPISK
jgi:hypothetical protein